MDNSTRKLLINYYWPGNVRELQNTIEYAINMSEPGQIITKEHLPQRIHANTVRGIKKKKTSYKKSLKELKILAIQEALVQFGNTTEGKKRAAAYLGISLSTINRHLREML
jgi:transcriptional regulator with PAS, ATPase and Fis domain